MYLHHTASVNNRMTPPEVYCNNPLLVYIQINVSCSIVATHYITGITKFVVASAAVAIAFH